VPLPLERFGTAASWIMDSQLALQSKLIPNVPKLMVA